MPLEPGGGLSRGSMDKTIHTAFRELPTGARLILFIRALGALPYSLQEAPSASQFCEQIATVWDEHRLTISHLSDPALTELLRSHLQETLQCRSVERR